MIICRRISPKLKFSSMNRKTRILFLKMLMRVHTNNSRVPITECTQFEADDDWPNCVRSICILGGLRGY